MGSGTDVKDGGKRTPVPPRPFPMTSGVRGCPTTPTLLLLTPSLRSGTVFDLGFKLKPFLVSLYLGTRDSVPTPTPLRFEGGLFFVSVWSVSLSVTGDHRNSGFPSPLQGTGLVAHLEDDPIPLPSNTPRTEIPSCLDWYVTIETRVVGKGKRGGDGVKKSLGLGYFYLDYPPNLYVTRVSVQTPFPSDSGGKRLEGPSFIEEDVTKYRVQVL